MAIGGDLLRRVRPFALLSFFFFFFFAKQLPLSPSLYSQISGPNDVTEFTQQDSVTSKFSFTADSGGSHKICFSNGAAVKRSVELEWASGAATIDYADVAKVEQLKPLELEMRKLEDRLSAVRREMQFQREREEAHRDTVRGARDGACGGARAILAVRDARARIKRLNNPQCSPFSPRPPSQSETTAGRVMWFSLLTIAIVVVQGVLQVLHLWTFFSRNKFPIAKSLLGGKRA